MKIKHILNTTTALHRKLYYVLFLMLSGISTAGLVRGQEVTLHAAFSRDTIMIGDQINFTFRVSQPEQLHVNIPVFTDTLAEGVEILQNLGVDTTKQGDRLDITHHYLVTSFDTTTVFVPPIKVSYERDSSHIILGTPTLALYVQPAMIDTSKTISDIKMPYKAPVTLAEILPYLLGLILLALIAWSIYRYVIKRKKPAGMQGVKAKSREPAHVIALCSLNQLKDEKLWQRGEVKGYYTRLTDILRVYLVDRYGLAAMEMTTMEILEGVKKNTPQDKKLIQTLSDILSAADLVKFAKWKPLHEQNMSIMEDAIAYVNETREVPVSMAPDGESANDGQSVPAASEGAAEKLEKEEHTHG